MSDRSDRASSAALETRGSTGHAIDAVGDRYDVIIAGARVAGASTAMLLARWGLRVLVVDPVPLGRDTLSTHALMRGAVLQLHRWGVLDRLRDARTPPIEATTFDYGDEVFTVPIKAKDGVDSLFAPRRTVLDPILVEAAVEAGAHVVHGLSLVDLARDQTGRVRGAWISGADGKTRLVSADLVIGADGLRSKVARLVEAGVVYQAKHCTASIYGYWTDLPTGDYRWYFRPKTGIGAIPTNGGASCVFASAPPEYVRSSRPEGLQVVHEQIVRTVDPELADAIAASPPTDKVRAFMGVPGFVRTSVGPGWALVGDAGYFRDPLTAHGITDALRDSELLARAATVGTEDALHAYQAVRDETSRPLMEVTDRIASLEWSMDEVKELHLELSRAMNVGVDLIGEWDNAAERPAERMPAARPIQLAVPGDAVPEGP